MRYPPRLTVFPCGECQLWFPHNGIALFVCWNWELRSQLLGQHEESQTGGLNTHPSANHGLVESIQSCVEFYHLGARTGGDCSGVDFDVAVLGAEGLVELQLSSEVMSPQRERVGTGRPAHVIVTRAFDYQPDVVLPCKVNTGFDVGRRGCIQDDFRISLVAATIT